MCILVITPKMQKVWCKKKKILSVVRCAVDANFDNTVAVLVLSLLLTRLVRVPAAFFTHPVQCLFLFDTPCTSVSSVCFVNLRAWHGTAASVVCGMEGTAALVMMSPAADWQTVSSGRCYAAFIVCVDSRSTNQKRGCFVYFPFWHVALTPETCSPYPSVISLTPAVNRKFSCLGIGV